MANEKTNSEHFYQKPSLNHLIEEQTNIHCITLIEGLVNRHILFSPEAVKMLSSNEIVQKYKRDDQLLFVLFLHFFSFHKSSFKETIQIHQNGCMYIRNWLSTLGKLDTEFIFIYL